MKDAIRTEPVTPSSVSAWLIEKIAHRLDVASDSVRTDQYFDEFGLDSTEALVLSAELEKWIGFELQTTALWYYPTIGELAGYIGDAALERFRTSAQASVQ